MVHQTSSDAGEARAFHDSLVVIDALNTSIMDAELLQRLHQAGVTAINYTITCTHGFHDTVRIMRNVDLLLEQYADIALRVDSAEDIERAKREGKVGIIYGTQNGVPIEDDPRNISSLRASGLRILQLTYQMRNLIAEGCLERTNGGLSTYGLAVVKELNRQRILIDLSHVGDASTMETIEVSERPPAITHACTRAVFDHPRNKPDDAIKAIGEAGGMFGVAAYPFLVDGESPTLDKMIDHVLHVVSLIGIDKVGIGLDFAENQPKDWLDTPRWGGSTTGQERWMYGSDEWPRTYPAGIGEVTEIPNITAGLLARGFTREETAKVMGGNWLRFLRESWQSTP